MPGTGITTTAVPSLVQLAPQAFECILVCEERSSSRCHRTSAHICHQIGQGTMLVRPKTDKTEQQKLRPQRCQTQSPVLKWLQCPMWTTNDKTLDMRAALPPLFFVSSFQLVNVSLSDESLQVSRNPPSYASAALCAMIDGMARAH